MKALICGKWELPFNVELKDESSIALHKRSYIHYIREHQDLVSAKCRATEWLLAPLQVYKSLSIREYMAGVGIQSSIIQGLLDVSRHVASELDHDCCKQLLSDHWKVPIEVREEDAKHAILRDDDSDYSVYFIDFPASSIVQILKVWDTHFTHIFRKNPLAVVWTDTSISYPIKIHGPRYSEIFGVNLQSQHDYIVEYSRWCHKRYGYSILRAAKRGSNALYFLGVRTETPVEPELGTFLLDSGQAGFCFMDELAAQI